MNEESGLLSRCIARDEDAWKEFLERYRRIIYGSILKTLEMRGHSRELAEDVFQDVLLKLLADDCRALRRFEGRSQTTTWLARISINATIDAVRRRKARREFSLPGEDEPDAEDTTEELLKRVPFDARILEGISSRDLAGQLLERLEDQDCLVLKLYFFSGLKEREIADLLQVPLNTLSSRKARAIEKLRSAARELLHVPSDEVESERESDPRGV
jgi:RNA polymerase sigma-70 factor (ECF subfamily)